MPVQKNLSQSSIRSPKVVSVGGAAVDGPQVGRLRALREFINECMAKKESYDWKCVQGAQPLATLEKFLFIWLAEKYGLKSLVVG